MDEYFLMDKRFGQTDLLSASSPASYKTNVWKLERSGKNTIGKGRKTKIFYNLQQTKLMANEFLMGH